MTIPCEICRSRYQN
uniref:Uncharacterized protein n=1 Tax=Anguilla anguilla TaxID=7936 RepID=A0A0E9UX66_ANGAN